MDVLFKASIGDGALSNLVSWKVFLPMGVGLQLGHLYGPF